MIFLSVFLEVVARTLAHVIGDKAEQPSLLLSQGRIKMQHERIGIPAKLGNDEGHSLSHQPSDECYVAGQAIELCNNYEALAAARAAASRGRRWTNF